MHSRILLCKLVPEKLQNIPANTILRGCTKRPEKRFSIIQLPSASGAICTTSEGQVGRKHLLFVAGKACQVEVTHPCHSAPLAFSYTFLLLSAERGKAVVDAVSRSFVKNQVMNRTIPRFEEDRLYQSETDYDPIV